MSRYRSILQSFLSAIKSDIRTFAPANMAAPKTSLSATTSSTRSPAKISDYPNLSHPPAQAVLAKQKTICDVKPLTIKVIDGKDGAVPAFLHLPHNYQQDRSNPHERTAAILLSGAGGGVVGPSGIYLSIADKLASLNKGIPVMRLDYRFPARNHYCVSDVKAAMDHLQNEYSVSRFVLTGWSFGGAPVFTVGGNDTRVVGCATVASQTADTDGVKHLSPRPLLLLHGTGDKTLSPSCSERLFKMYGTKGERELKLFDGDDHALTQNSLKAEEMLCSFIMKCAGAEIGDGESKIMEEDLVGDGDRADLMKRGGDLKGGESIE